jgi:hypothetical protein
MKFGLVFFLICSVIVIKIFGWTIGLLILIPAGILLSVIYSIINGVGNFIDDRIDHHYDRKNQSETDYYENETEFYEHEEDDNEEYVKYEYRDKDNK